jgi:type I restriction enzyme S subunit
MNVADREYCIGRGVAAIRGRDGIAATPFVQQVLTWIAPRILAEASAGGSTFPNITDSRLKEWPIIAPPLVEQWGIAAVLGRIQAAVAVQQTIFDRVAELKAAMMAKFFSVGIHGGDSQDTEAGPVPANWTVNRLIEIARVERGKFTHRPRNDPAFYGGDIPFIQTGDVTAANGRVNTYSQTLNQRGLSVSKMFPRGTILTTIAANIGDFAILDFTCAFPDSIVGITPHSSNLTEFLCYFLQTRKAYLNHIAPRGTQKNVSLKILEPLPVALPSDDAERQEIVEILQAIDARHETAIRQCQLYQELFNVVRDQLMTGRIRVGDLSLTELAGANS